MQTQDSLATGPAEAGTEGQWMTIAELAAMRGISMGSVTRLIRRQRWRRQADHQGHVRVLVPHGAIRRAEQGRPEQGRTGSGRTGSGHAGNGAAGNGRAEQSCVDEPAGDLPDRHAAMVRDLRERLEAAEQRAGRAELRAREAEQARAAAEASAAAERERVAVLIARIEATLAVERRARAAAEATAREVVQLDRAVQIAVQAEAAQLRQLRQAAAARRSLGRVERLLAAWRGD